MSVGHIGFYVFAYDMHPGFHKSKLTFTCLMFCLDSSESNHFFRLIKTAS